MFKANLGLQARCISQSVLKVCLLACLAVIWHVFTCEGLPAALPFSLLDLFPAAIVPLSAAVLLLFLSHWDDLGHWHTATHTWPRHTQTHTVRQLHVRHLKWRTLINRLTLGSFFKRWDAAISKFYFKNWNDFQWFLSLSEYINKTVIYLYTLSKCKRPSLLRDTLTYMMIIGRPQLQASVV